MQQLCLNACAKGAVCSSGDSDSDSASLARAELSMKPQHVTISFDGSSVSTASDYFDSASEGESSTDRGSRKSTCLLSSPCEIPSIGLIRGPPGLSIADDLRMGDAPVAFDFGQMYSREFYSTADADGLQCDADQSTKDATNKVLNGTIVNSLCPEHRSRSKIISLCEAIPLHRTASARASDPMCCASQSLAQSMCFLPQDLVFVDCGISAAELQANLVGVDVPMETMAAPSAFDLSRGFQLFERFAVEAAAAAVAKGMLQEAMEAWAKVITSDGIERS